MNSLGKGQRSVQDRTQITLQRTIPTSNCVRHLWEASAVLNSFELWPQAICATVSARGNLISWSFNIHPSFHLWLWFRLPLKAIRKDNQTSPNPLPSLWSALLWNTKTCPDLCRTLQPLCVRGSFLCNEAAFFSELQTFDLRLHVKFFCHPSVLFFHLSLLPLSALLLFLFLFNSLVSDRWCLESDACCSEGEIKPTLIWS